MQTFDSLSDPRFVRALQNGAVGILPTDTIYGIVCQATNPSAVAKLYEAKHRERKPGTLIAATPEQLIGFGIDARYVNQVAGFWPNSLSVVLPAPDTLTYVHQGKDSLAVRVPRDAALHQLLLQTGPLLTSSANMPGEPPAETVAEAQRFFGATVDFYVDGGSLAQRPPSTIVRLNADGTLELLRQGAVTIDVREISS